MKCFIQNNDPSNPSNAFIENIYFKSDRVSFPPKNNRTVFRPSHCTFPGPPTFFYFGYMSATRSGDAHCRPVAGLSMRGNVAIGRPRNDFRASIRESSQNICSSSHENAVRNAFRMRQWIWLTAFARASARLFLGRFTLSANLRASNKTPGRNKISTNTHLVVQNRAKRSGRIAIDGYDLQRARKRGRLQLWAAHVFFWEIKSRLSLHFKYIAVFGGDLCAQLALVKKRYANAFADRINVYVWVASMADVLLLYAKPSQLDLISLN